MTMLDSSPERPFAAGCIRFTAAGPQWYINDSHIPVGFNTDIAPVALSNGRLHVKMLTSYPVSGAIADPDEWLTEQEISAGISGGVADCNISMVKRGMGRRLQLDDPAEYALVQNDLSNLWLLVGRVIPATAPVEQ